MISLTKREAIKIIESTNREYERFLCNLNRRYHTKPERLSLEAAVLAQQYDDVYRCVNSSLWRFYKNTKSGDLKAILDEYLILCRNFNFRTLQSFPKEEFMVSEAEDKMPEAIDAALEKLEGYGDEQIQKAVRQCREGKRIIEFSSMDERQNGQTYRVNDFYSHYITDRFKENTIENQVRLAVTLAHELKRNAATDSLEAETQEIVLSDTKIIESFSGTYGEEIYKKFPEYGILHYIKKIFGETELKEFADYAFDSTGSYWKVNEAGDLADDGNASRVADAKGSELYSGAKGLQGTLQEWLGMENAYAALMQPAGFEWNGKKWSKNPGKIDHSVIEKAHNDGHLTDDQYNLIQLAAGKSASDDKSEKINLFKQFFSDYKQANIIKTQVQIDMANRAWEWLQIQRKKMFGKNSSAENKTDKYNQLNERYEKVKNVKYSNDTTKIDYDSNYKPLDTTTYFNCISFVCYMYNISASYSVSNFDKYTQFSELKDIKNVNQLQIGDVITWEYESGEVDKNSKPIYEYHASIWKGNDEIWECMEPKGVRTRVYSSYCNYMNNKGMKIHTVKYFRYTGGSNEEK